MRSASDASSRTKPTSPPSITRSPSSAPAWPAPCWRSTWPARATRSTSTSAGPTCGSPTSKAAARSTSGFPPAASKRLRHAGSPPSCSKQAVVMDGRVVHGQDRRTSFHPYGKDRSEVLHSIDRKALNRLLLDEAEQHGARIHFEERCVAVDKAERTLTFRQRKDRRAAPGGHRPADRRRRRLFGGARLPPGGALGEFHQEWLPWGYKELQLPADKKAARRSSSTPCTSGRAATRWWCRIPTRTARTP